VSETEIQATDIDTAYKTSDEFLASYFDERVTALNDTFHKEINTFREEINTLVREEINTIHDEIDTFHDESNAFNDIDTHNKEINTIIDTFHEEINTIHGEIDTIHDEIDTIHEEISTIREEINTIHEELETYQVLPTTKETAADDSTGTTVRQDPIRTGTGIEDPESDYKDSGSDSKATVVAQHNTNELVGNGSTSTKDTGDGNTITKGSDTTKGDDSKDNAGVRKGSLKSINSKNDPPATYKTQGKDDKLLK